MIVHENLSYFFAVTHDLDNKRAWAPCLRVEGVKLPTGYYLGASAATGINISYIHSTQKLCVNVQLGSHITYFK